MMDWLLIFGLLALSIWMYWVSINCHIKRLQKLLAACKARGVKRRVPYFFVCLENILQLTPEEKAFICSDEPLYTDGKDIKDFIFQLRRTYEKSGSQLEYHEWVRQNYLPASKV